MSKLKGIVRSHKYIHRDVYDTHQLCAIDDAQLMTKSVIVDAFLQAAQHVKHTSIQFFGVMTFCLVYSLPHFKSNIVVSPS